MANITGWGRGTWGQGTWGQPIPVVLSGLAGTSSLGSITVSANADVTVSGLNSTSALGNVTTDCEANVIPNGQVGTSALGTIIAKGTANVGCPAVSATLGNVSVNISGDCSVILTTGLSSTSSLGNITTKANADISVTLGATTSGLGLPSLICDNNITLTGFTGVSSLGEIGIIGKSVVIPNGLEITAGSPNVTVWGKIDDSQTPDWSSVSDSQTPNWSSVSDSQTPNWEKIEAA